MELWKNFDRLVVFDTETTGIEFGRDRIIEIGAVALENGALVLASTNVGVRISFVAGKRTLVIQIQLPPRYALKAGSSTRRKSDAASLAAETQKKRRTSNMAPFCGCFRFAYSFKHT